MDSVPKQEAMQISAPPPLDSLTASLVTTNTSTNTRTTPQATSDIPSSLPTPGSVTHIHPSVSSILSPDNLRQIMALSPSNPRPPSSSSPPPSAVTMAHEFDAVPVSSSAVVESVDKSSSDFPVMGSEMGSGMGADLKPHGVLNAQQSSTEVLDQSDTSRGATQTQPLQDSTLQEAPTTHSDQSTMMQHDDLAVQDEGEFAMSSKVAHAKQNDMISGENESVPSKDAAVVAANPSSNPTMNGALENEQSALQDAAREETETINPNDEANFIKLTITSDSTPNPSAALPDGSVSPAKERGRLPHDTIGLLEDRVKDDPRGDMEAWLALINEFRKRGKVEATRAVYERCLAIFPFSAEVWLSYAQMENEASDRHAVDSVLGKSLMQVPYVPLWSMYLDHVQRHNNLTTDASSTARQTINSAYDLALTQVGIDKDSGKLWQDYIAFIKSGPGVVGGSTWQDQQKMDLLRKAYQRAICIPTQATNLLWKEYDGFEMGLNKMTDQSPAYMSARSSYTELQNITRNLDRTTLPTLPPLMGFDGYIEYMDQLKIWKRWIQWELDDPLVLKKEDMEAYTARIVFVYRHALMALRFWPELWCEASDFCFTNGLEDQGHDFLLDGMTANPESCLLAFKRADRLELASVNEEGADKIAQRAAMIKEPYDMLLTALYQLVAKARSTEEEAIAKIEAQFAALDQQDNIEHGLNNDSKDDGEVDEAKEQRMKTYEIDKNRQIDAAKTANAVQSRLVSRTISFAWIALMRALRRVQGKGGVDQGGARGTFQEARRRGRITSDVYVEAALIEFHCYDPDTGTKIFERGLKLFQEDERFALEYIKHLVANNDHTNARVVFETVATRLAQKPETAMKAKPLYAFFHEFESRYGELAQITKLEKRMQTLFPEDTDLSLFTKRYIDDDFDPTAIRPIISPAKQTRPILQQVPPILVSEVDNRQAPGANQAFVETQSLAITSPKRSLPTDAADADKDRPKKMVRGDSPNPGTKAVAPDQDKLAVNTNSTHTVAGLVNGNSTATSNFQVIRGADTATNNAVSSALPPLAPPPPPLPRDVTFLLSIIPPASTYRATKFDADKMVKLIRETTIPHPMSQSQAQSHARSPSSTQASGLSMSMGQNPAQSSSRTSYGVQRATTMTPSNLGPNVPSHTHHHQTYSQVRPMPPHTPQNSYMPQTQPSTGYGHHLGPTPTPSHIGMGNMMMPGPMHHGMQGGPGMSGMPMQMPHMQHHASPVSMMGYPPYGGQPPYGYGR